MIWLMIRLMILGLDDAMFDILGLVQKERDKILLGSL